MSALDVIKEPTQISQSTQELLIQQETATPHQEGEQGNKLNFRNIGVIGPVIGVLLALGYVAIDDNIEFKTILDRLDIRNKISEAGGDAFSGDNALKIANENRIMTDPFIVGDQEYIDAEGNLYTRIDNGEGCEVGRNEFKQNVFVEGDGFTMVRKVSEVVVYIPDSDKVTEDFRNFFEIPAGQKDFMIAINSSSFEEIANQCTVTDTIFEKAPKTSIDTKVGNSKTALQSFEQGDYPRALWREQ